ncbi:hypothetical protein FXN63_20890 [Pigmentiphaga aceris]|uniref:Uncharacterized protein n=1 Tax=Pigmentiphaga aceris TaxID=1940612 RepID=A0A5C0AZX8_9BURK|nr:hypothetical protein [Pigmentiphaga aceris]QEI08022.1 hypothetical protein FXN63_20890 [Pigmentiphaga aceris]
MSRITTLAANLQQCLDAADIDAALLALGKRGIDLDVLESPEKPHAVIGLAALLTTAAQLRAGYPELVAPLLDGLSDALAPAHRRGEGNWRVLGPFRFLFAPLIDAALAMQSQGRAIDLLNSCRREMRGQVDDGSYADPQVAALIAHPAFMAVAGFVDKRHGDGRHTHVNTSGSPFHIDWPWLLTRYEQALALGQPDHRLMDVQTCHAGLVESALLAEVPKRAMPLIDQELDWYLSNPAIDTSHFEFNAICVLAVLGQYERALESARILVRRGYHLPWRFRLASAQRMVWTQDMRQNEWLGDLAQTPAYQRFVEEELPGPMLDDDADCNPLCVVKDGTWTGKKPKRCAVSRVMIQPGGEVVRFRRLFNRASDGGLEMADRDAFAASDWQVARAKFDANAIPLAKLFPRNVTRDAKLDGAPHIHAFVHALARAPGNLDMAQAVSLIAEHAPPPVPYTWNQGTSANRWALAIPGFAGADGHGDAISLAWCLVKAGYRETLLAQVASLPTDRADKVFAMLATFDDEVMRQAAAVHFALPDLPQIMALVFKDRLALEDHALLAAFGHQHARYRAGLVAAMRAYGLHLYSNNRPKVDWFLAGLEHYSLAGGSALLYLLIDHPEDDPVLQTVIDKGWLPDKALGSVDDYANTKPFYVRAALFHLARHQPERLDAWLTPDAVLRWTDMAYDRETLRLVKKLKARKPASQRKTPV